MASGISAYKYYALALVLAVAALYVIYFNYFRGPPVLEGVVAEVTVRSGHYVESEITNGSSIRLFVNGNKNCGFYECFNYVGRINSSTREGFVNYTNKTFGGPTDVYDLSIDYNGDGIYDDSITIDTRPRFQFLELDEKKKWYGEIPLIFSEINPPKPETIVTRDSGIHVIFNHAEDFWYNVTCDCISKLSTTPFRTVDVGTDEFGRQMRMNGNNIELFVETLRNTTEWVPFISQKKFREWQVVGDESRWYYINFIEVEHNYILEKQGNVGQIKLERKESVWYKINHTRVTQPDEE